MPKVWPWQISWVKEYKAEWVMPLYYNVIYKEVKCVVILCASSIEGFSSLTIRPKSVFDSITKVKGQQVTLFSPNNNSSNK